MTQYLIWAKLMKFIIHLTEFSQHLIFLFCVNRVFSLKGGVIPNKVSYRLKEIRIFKKNITIRQFPNRSNSHQNGPKVSYAAHLLGESRSLIG